jgi:hypothetical protein
MLAALPAFVAPLVVWRADDAAAGRAYCIEVAQGPISYRTAASLKDVMGYTMRARRGERGRYTGFHAVLFVARPEAKIAEWGQPAFERLNWSYRELRFVPIVGQGHAALGDAPACTPVPGFARLLAPL